LVSVNLCDIILAAVLRSATLCIRPRKHLTYVVRDYSFNSTHACPASSQNFVGIFCSDSEAILSCISALCPGGQTFHSFSENYLKHEITLAKNLIRKESKLPMSLEQFVLFITTKAAFDFYW